MASSVTYADGAVIAPEFQADTPGRYDIDVTIEAVPFAASKRPLFDKDAWTAALQAKGANCRVVAIKFIQTKNPRSTAGDILSVFGAGTDVSDWDYRVTVDYFGSGGNSSGVSGLGALGGFWLAAIIIVGVVDLLYYAFTGSSIVITGVRYAGQVVQEVIREGVAKPLAETSYTLLWVAAAAVGVMFLFNKAGGKVRTKHFESG